MCLRDHYRSSRLGTRKTLSRLSCLFALRLWTCKPQEFHFFVSKLKIWITPGESTSQSGSEVQMSEYT